MESPVFELDEAARHKFAGMREAGRFEGSALRVSVAERGASFRYSIERVAAESRRPEDEVLEAVGVAFFVDPQSAARLRGARLEYVESLAGGGFRFENPNRPRLLELPLAVAIQKLLDEEVNPGIAGHGGRVALVDLQEGRAVVEFGGGCQGCGMADLTLREGVAAAIQQAFPDISEVVDATDHEAGTSPYHPR